MKKVITKKVRPLYCFYNLTNTGLKMKLTIFLLVVSLFKLQASAYSENTTLALNTESASELSDEIDYIDSDGLLFLAKIDGHIAINNEALTPPPPKNKTSQERAVKGVVTDENNDPIPGVNILLKGTSIGVTSDFDGKYSIKVPNEAAILQFSFVGYQTKEVVVGDREIIDVQLIQSDNELEEIVVVGYGVQKRETITGAVSAVQGSDLVKSPVLNLTNTLAGRIAGLFVKQSSAEPGQDDSNIRIRGTNTFNNTGALIVIDGIPDRAGGLSRINSADIENISVLKDASAAIYGARAANGVILVTTKRGKRGKPKLSYSFNQGWSQPVSIPRLANATEYAELLNELSVYELDTNQWKAAAEAYSTGQPYTRPDGSIKNPPFSQKDLELFGNGEDPWGHPNTDWFGDTFKTWSPQAKHTLQLTGGTEKTTYYASIGYQDQDAYYKNSATGYKQYDFRLNLDTEINDYVKIAVGILGRQEFRFYPTQSAQSIFRMLLRSKPTKPAYWPNGLPGPDIENGQNPVAITTSATGYDRDKRDFFQSNASVNIKVPGIEGLSFKGTAAVDKNFRNAKRWNIPWFLYTWDGSTYESDKKITGKLVKGKRGPSEPRLNQRTFNTLNILLGASAKYKRTFEDHNVEVLAGVNRETQFSENFNAFRRFFISTTLDQLFAGGDEEKDNGGGASEQARLNYYGRVLYNYQEKYLVEFLGRYDGSYLFPKDTRFGFFPGVSAGWVISKEEFFNEDSFINFLKIRGSWGQLGNDDVPRFQYLATYGFGSYIINNAPVTIINESRVPDTSITWEVATNSNFGIEAGFLDRRLRLEFDYFSNKRTGILTRPSISIPNFSGISASNQNIGKVVNKGVDLLIGYNDQIGDFSFGAVLTAGYAKNKLVHIDEPEADPETFPQYQKREGKPIGTRFVYGYAGIFKNQADIDAETLDYSKLTGTLRPGDMKLVDYDGDGFITPKDRYRTDKNNDPRLTYGINMTASYKNFDLSMLLQGAGGSEILLTSAGGDFGNYPSYIYENRWTVNNESSVDPRITERAEEYFSSGNSYWIQSTNYIRLKNIELGYTLPKEISSKFGITNLRFYASGLNIFTITNSFFDPESTSSDGNYYPNPRIINTGFSFSF